MQHANKEAVTGGVQLKKLFLKVSQNSHENTCARDSFLIKLQASVFNFIRKETLTQLFYYEFFRICKNFEVFKNSDKNHYKTKTVTVTIKTKKIKTPLVAITKILTINNEKKRNK